MNFRRRHTELTEYQDQHIWLDSDGLTLGICLRLLIIYLLLFIWCNEIWHHKIPLIKHVRCSSIPLSWAWLLVLDHILARSLAVAPVLRLWSIFLRFFCQLPHQLIKPRVGWHCRLNCYKWNWQILIQMFSSLMR